ncbi:helix-turn-helix domain-containing protein [Pseudomonas sp. H3(2019)]|uniref:helix-turn-helix domain-containing protein n=1 Tax=Pseudomonas sp. H3(2019) TaxID=2598724 RepID=UPI001193625A|nr:AraC family transcriptional regulator [Pseudomonas sp. H3(2019)]TVT86025.1 helix-turn-helix transcriptional regulator [Pseudomonas sp. H3(2019)]
MSPQPLKSDHPCNLARPLGALSGWQERRAKAFMLRDLTRSLRVSEIAEHCHLSRSHFSRAFKIVTGCSPQEWMLKMKIDKAKCLLLTAMPITDIVYECGFSDHSHFTRTFGRMLGISPRAWRQAVCSTRAPVIEQNSGYWSPSDIPSNPKIQTHPPELRP